MKKHPVLKTLYPSHLPTAFLGRSANVIAFYTDEKSSRSCTHYHFCVAMATSLPREPLQSRHLDPQGHGFLESLWKLERFWGVLA